MSSVRFTQIVTIIFFVTLSLINPSLTSGIGETCSEDLPCTPKNSFCPVAFPPGAESKCRCIENHVVYTLDSSSCTTGSPFFVDTVACIPIVNNLNDQCGVDIQCKSGNMGQFSHCSSEDSTCQCLSNATYSQTQATCLPLAVNLGDPCTDGHLGFQCKNIPFANCKSGTCQCQDDRVEHPDQKNTCIVAAKRIGDPCTKQPEECDLLIGAICLDDPTLDKTCQCNATTRVVNEARTQCLHKVHALNEFCSISAQCQVTHSRCLQGKSRRECQCSAGFVQSEAIEYPNVCLPTQPNITGECTENVQCTTELGNYSECHNNECRCKENGVLYNNQKCYPLAAMGDQCDVDEQCIPNSDIIPLTCNLDLRYGNETISRCGCPRLTHNELEGICYEKSGYNLPCSSDNQCKASLEYQGGVMICHQENSTCGCPVDHIIKLDETNCIPRYVALGEPCEESRQCYASAFETNQYCDFNSGLCICSDGYVAEDGIICRSMTSSTTGSPTTNTPPSSVNIVRCDISLLMMAIIFLKNLC